MFEDMDPMALEFEWIQKMTNCGTPVFLDTDPQEEERAAARRAREEQFQSLYDSLGMPEETEEPTDSTSPQRKRKVEEPPEESTFGVRVFNDSSAPKKQKTQLNNGEQTAPRARIQSLCFEPSGSGPFYTAFRMAGFEGVIKGELPCEERRLFEYEIVAAPDTPEPIHAGTGSRFVRFDKPAYQRRKKGGGRNRKSDLTIKTWKVFPVAVGLDTMHETWETIFARYMAHNFGRIRSDELKKVRQTAMDRLDSCTWVKRRQRVESLGDSAYTQRMEVEDDLEEANARAEGTASDQRDPRQPFWFRKWLLFEAAGPVSAANPWPKHAADIANGKSNMDFWIACHLPILLRIFPLEQLVQLPYPELSAIHKSIVDDHDFVSLFFHRGDGRVFSSSWPQITVENLMKLHNENIDEVAELFRQHNVTEEEFCAIWWYHCIQTNQEQMGATCTDVQRVDPGLEKAKILKAAARSMAVRRTVTREFTIELDLDTWFPKKAHEEVCSSFGRVYRTLYMDTFSSASFQQPPQIDRSIRWLLEKRRVFLFDKDTRLVLDRYWNDAEYTLRALREWNAKLLPGAEERKRVWQTTDEYIAWTKVNSGVCELAEEQKAVLVSLAAYPVTLLIGPPGAGKSHIEKFITGRDAVSREESQRKKAEQRRLEAEERKRSFARNAAQGPNPPQQQNRAQPDNQEQKQTEDLDLASVLFLAPTNRLTAAQMRKLRRPVMTLDMFCAIHKGGIQQKYKHVRLVVIDEGTMCAASLLGDTLRVAILYLPSLERIKILGDLRQLPSISPGATFRDLIFWSDSHLNPDWAQKPFAMPLKEFGFGPVCRLTQNHRASHEARVLVEAMEAVADSDPDRFMGLMTDNVLEMSWINDPDPEAAFLGTWDEIASTAIGGFADKNLKTLVNTQIICFRNTTRVKANLWCMRKCEFITEEEMVRLSSSGRMPREVFVGEKITFNGRIADQDVFKNRVVVIVRLYVDTSLAGDRCDAKALRDVRSSSEFKGVRTQQERWYMDVEDVDCPGQIYEGMHATHRVLNMIQPGYAVTTHSMEGGECDNVIFILEPWVDNQLFLTALSRARSSVKIRLDPELVQHIEIQLRLKDDDQVTGTTCIEYVTRYRKPPRRTIFGEVLRTQGMDFIRPSPAVEPKVRRTEEPQRPPSPTAELLA